MTDVLKTAIEEIGTIEEPRGSNRVKYNKWYYGKDVSGSAYPWCMAFVQWVFAQASRPLPFRTASCGALLRWYKEHDRECIVKEPKPGDIVIYDLPDQPAATDHCGILEQRIGDYVTTIDGNTGGDGAVMRRTRPEKYVHAYIRPRVPAPAPELSEVDRWIADLTPEQAYKILVKAQDYLRALPLPTSWNSAEQLAEAKALGITDGTRPMDLCTRLEAAVMASRAAFKG